MGRNEARICIAVIIAASGCADATAPLARTVTAATAAPVLSENFETPKTANYTVYRTGQTFTTATNTWVVESGTIDLLNAQVRREAVLLTVFKQSIWLVRRARESSRPASQQRRARGTA